MAILVLDPTMEAMVRAECRVDDPERSNEVWEGVTVVAPVPNNEHYRIASFLNTAFAAVVDWDRGDQAVPGGNVTDRDDGWEHNYRNPDVIVALAGGNARDHGTHWLGGPDLVVEITSPGEKPYDKLGFYAGVCVREVLIVHRNPWWVELQQLQRGAFVPAGRSELPSSATLTSAVLPLTFRLITGPTRPVIEMVHTATGQRWTA